MLIFLLVNGKGNISRIIYMNLTLNNIIWVKQKQQQQI